LFTTPDRFDVSKGTYGSLRILVDLREAGWTISKKTVEVSMRRQELVARPKKAKGGLTRADRRARKAPDRLNRDFGADVPDEKWCGDMTEIGTGEGPLVLATTEDLFSRRALGFAMGESATAELAKASLQMAAAHRGGSVTGVIFHSDQGSTYTADEFEKACSKLGVARSIGRVGSSLDNALAESQFSLYKDELVRNRGPWRDVDQMELATLEWVSWFNHTRLHSSLGDIPLVEFEAAHYPQLTASGPLGNQ
jgi:transposase InsO family protein